MTKRLAGLIVVAVALLLSSCVSSTLIFTERDVENSSNLIGNPSFNPYSNVASEALKGWSIHLDPPGGDSSPVIIDPSETKEGRTSLRINASAKSVLILSDSFTVRRYGGYYLRSYVKTNSPLPPLVQLRFIAFKENGKIVNRFRHKRKPDTQWGLNTISAGFIKPGAKFGRVGIFIPPFKEGSIWIDDVGCFEVHGFKID
ncbi:MAG: hypothetical protein RBS43_07240 [Candidatus Cloacimonas sp.]|jgi:hypothetical protein|nr:hypothetical protein [Candidatus Cloacimonas sp.]